MDDDWDPQRGTLVQHMIAGSCAGVFEHTLMFPVDTVKTHAQAHVGRGARNVLSSLWQSGGFLRLWRGAPAVVGACIPSHAAFFSVYEVMKHKLGVDMPGHHPTRAAVAGASATTLHDAIITPMDVVKQRLQLGYYRGIVDCMRTVLREEGALALYRSYPVTLGMNLPFHAVVVATNETMKKVINPSGEHDISVFLLCGAAAGGAAAVVTNPLDVIKTRLQTQQCVSRHAGVAPGRGTSTHHGVHTRSSAKVQFATFGTARSPRYVGIGDTARAVWAEGGVAAFFKGTRARLLFHMPSMAIAWTTYEAVRHVLVGSAA